MSPSVRLATAMLLGAGLAFSPAYAQNRPQQQAQATPPVQAQAEPALPADSVTHHTLELPGRTLQFTATAGSFRLTNAQNAPQAAIAYIEYRLDGADAAQRPVTFVMNGGPGSASAWLQLGLLGPWRMPMDPQAAAPSAPAAPAPNADTWLDFTDLVFIDPAGAGFSRVLGGDEVRKRLWSVSGDIDSLAETIRIWLERRGRMTSPKFLLGESYGGFRGPRLVRALANEQGIGIGGLVLVSPVLDFGGRSNAFDPMSWVGQLPSIAAAMRAKEGPVTRESLADVEAYAAGDYLVDLVRGDRDPDALARRIARVAELTGLDPALLRRHHGKLSNGEFLRERDRDAERVSSAYDATVTIPNPFPQATIAPYPDPMTDGLSAPFTSAMMELYGHQLNWLPQGPYLLLNGTANRQWDYTEGRGRPEAMSALRTALSLDPKLRVVVATGLFDFVTPYFATKLLLDQLPTAAGGDRVRLVVYPGGHMFYSRDESRAAFRDAVQPLYAPR
jgi:carboxypeptidase C (cathepsin A)